MSTTYWKNGPSEEKRRKVDPTTLEMRSGTKMIEIYRLMEHCQGFVTKKIFWVGKVYLRVYKDDHLIGVKGQFTIDFFYIQKYYGNF